LVFPGKLAARLAIHAMSPDPAAPPGRTALAWRQLPWLLVGLQLAWCSYGVWPITPVEGDEQGVIFGVEGMLRHDDMLLRSRYKYDVQPGSYHLLAALARLTGASVETVFGATTVAGALGFAVAGAWLLKQMLAWPVAWTLAAMLWAQEVTAAACYSNTSALAGGIAILAVTLAAQSRPSGWLWSGVALAVAGWLRADSLLIAPACLGLAYWQLRAWRPAILRTAAIALIATIGVAGLYWLSGTSLHHAIEVYDTQMGPGLAGRRLWVDMPVQLLSPALVLAALGGSALMLWRREFALGLVILSGVVATLMVYGGVITTPKYLYYLVPFALLPALIFVGWLECLPTWLARLALAALLLGDGLLGLRTLLPSERYFTTAPTGMSLAQIATGPKAIELVIGPGELVINCDGFRVRTGQFFAPLCWHREKERVRTDLAIIRSWLSGGRELTIYWANWLPGQIAVRELLAGGFRPSDASPSTAGTMSAEIWQRQGQVVRLHYLGYVGSISQSTGPAAASSTAADTYFIGDGANHPITELADHRRWHLLSAVPEGLVTLHQRR
jgi:hypothetical protein